MRIRDGPVWGKKEANTYPYIRAKEPDAPKGVPGFCNKKEGED